MDSALRNLQQLDAKVLQAKKRGELRAATLIANDARSNAKGSLGSKIAIAQNDITTTVIGGDNISAYVEFGTGDFAAAYLSTMPPEVKAEAEKFYVDGTGRIPANPFFFPAIFRNQDKVIEFVNEELNKISK